MNTWTDAMLENYLDDLLKGSDRALFETRTANDPILRKAQQAQSAIDAALWRLFSPPSSNAAWKRGLPNPSTLVRAKSSLHGGNLRRYLGVAALIAFTTVGTWRLWTHFTTPPLVDPYAPQEWRSLETVYRDSITEGFKPAWICKSEDEFATYFRRSTGKPLILGQTPANIKALGLSHCNCVTPTTIYLLARVDDTEVLVFADRASRDTGQTLPDTSPMHLFKRVFDGAVLYELTPKDAPVLLEYFYEFDGDQNQPEPGEPSRWERDASPKPQSP